VAAKTQSGAIRMSQVEAGSDPSDSIGGVSFRHLSMLAQIKSSDGDVWASLNRSGHIQGEPGESLAGRLVRMRSWIDGPHFPEDARLEVRREIGKDAKDNLDEDCMVFLSNLSSLLSKCEWNDGGISESISSACDSAGIPMRKGYSAIYWALLEKSYGPKASSLLCEVDRDAVLILLGSA